MKPFKTWDDVYSFADKALGNYSFLVQVKGLNYTFRYELEKKTGRRYLYPGGGKLCAN